MASLPSVTVTSVRTPTITWRCPTCHRHEVFTCSERFRTNTNGKLADIWLIYRCRRCEATKNITVVERTPVRKLPHDLLEAAEGNDAVIARRLARNVELLRRAGASVHEGDAWTIVPADEAPAGGDCRHVRLVFPEPLLLRLDAVVATATRRPRRLVRSAIRVPEGSTRVDSLRLWSTTEVQLDWRAAPPPGSGQGQSRAGFQVARIPSGLCDQIHTCWS